MFLVGQKHTLFFIFLIKELEYLNMTITNALMFIEETDRLIIFLYNILWLLKEPFVCAKERETHYLLLVYLVTAFVPSLTACLASSPGRMRRTAVWISRDVMVDFLL